MKNLILIRHAKSSWDLPVNDKDRHLSNRGVVDAHLISSNILKYLPKKFVIFSSNAKRAIETATIFAQNWMSPFESIIFRRWNCKRRPNSIERKWSGFEF